MSESSRRQKVIARAESAAKASAEAREENILLASQITRKRKADNTLDSYARRIETFRIFLINRFPTKTIIDANGREVSVSIVDNSVEGGVRMDLVEADMYTEFMAHICKKTNKDGAYLEPVVYQSFENVSGYNSCFKHYYTSQKTACPFEVTTALKHFLDGYSRKVGELKLTGEMRMEEGKSPFSFAAYTYMAQKALNYKKDFAVATFAHLYLLLSWNLIARCNSVGSLIYQHIEWSSNDALLITFPTHKGDKEGKNSAPKHVYANPFKPEVCPILAFAVYVFCQGVHRENLIMSVFGDPDAAENRFSKWLKSECAPDEEMLMSFGYTPEMVGTHSFRKGVATHLAGMPGGPSGIHIYLRAGWSLGNVPSRYILEGQGGDQLCGRAATGLCLNERSFAALPPHFHFGENPNLLTRELWDAIVPGYSLFPKSFRPVFPYLLASLCFHSEWLQQRLDPQHPIFISSVWTSGLISSLKPHVKSGCTKNEESGMFATGIPPHILLANELFELKEEMKEMKQDLALKMESLPVKLRDLIREYIATQGGGITRLELLELLANQKSSVLEAICEELDSRQLTKQSSPTVSEVAEDFIIPPGSKYKLFYWINMGKYSRVRQDFRFPTKTVDVLKLFHLWVVGNPAKEYPPYSILKSADLPFPKEDKGYMSKARCVMNHLLALCGKSKAELEEMTAAQREKVLHDTLLTFYATNYVNKESRNALTNEDLRSFDRKKLGSISYLSIYNDIQNGKKQSA